MSLSGISPPGEFLVYYANNDSRCCRLSKRTVEEVGQPIMQSTSFDGSGSQTGSTVGPMYVQTPLIVSRTLAKVAGCNVYLKLENTQPSGSFKLRGISNVVRKVRSRYGVILRLVHKGDIDLLDWFRLGSSERRTC